MTTLKQKQAVKFIEEELNIEFIGNIHNQYEVSNFIGRYLANAKEHYEIHEWECYEALGSIGDMWI